MSKTTEDEIRRPADRGPFTQADREFLMEVGDFLRPHGADWGLEELDSLGRIEPMRLPASGVPIAVAAHWLRDIRDSHQPVHTRLHAAELLGRVAAVAGIYARPYDDDSLPMWPGENPFQDYNPQTNGKRPVGYARSADPGDPLPADVRGQAAIRNHRAAAYPETRVGHSGHTDSHTHADSSCEGQEMELGKHGRHA